MKRKNKNIEKRRKDSTPPKERKSKKE